MERIGVERSRQVLKEADLVILLLNGSEVLSPEDERLLETIRPMDAIIVVNKTDLPQQIDIENVKQLASQKHVITASILQDEGVDELEETIANLFFGGGIEAEDPTYVSNERHIALLHQAKTSIEDAIQAAEARVPIDMIQIDITRTWELLGEIVGDTVQDSLINQLFSQFCLGK